MTTRLIVIVFLLAAFGLSLAAQGTTQHAKRRAGHNLSTRIDNRVDQGVDKAFDAVEGLFKKKEQPEAEGSHTVGDSAAAVSEPFQNDHPFSLTMTVTEKKRNREEVSTVRLGASTDQIAMVTSADGGGESARMIFDTRDGKTTMITTDKKGETQAFRMRMPRLGGLIDRAGDDVASHLKVTRTDERRTIDGYACELVIVENTKEKTTTRSWITHDLDLSGEEVFGTIGRMMGGSGASRMPLPPGLTDLQDGFPIEATTVDGNSTYEMRFTDIRIGDGIDRSLFDTTGVEVRDMGF